MIPLFQLRTHQGAHISWQILFKTRNKSMNLDEWKKKDQKRKKKMRRRKGESEEMK